MRPPGRARRTLVALAVFALAVGTAAGPSRVAGAVTGLVTAGDGPQFLPEPTPVRVQSPSLAITDLQAADAGSPIALAGGGRSPDDTILLRFSTIRLDDLSITQSQAGPFALAITNASSGDGAAQIGGAGETVSLWGVVHSLDFCLDGANGVCLPIAQALPIIGTLLKTGVGLPATIPVNNLDIDVYALQVDAPSGRQSLDLPNGLLTVRPS